MGDRAVELGWMRLFAEVGRQRSLSSAAAALGLTQPAISYQIRRIEEQMGVALLLRVHRGVELTREGQSVFEIASRTVAEIDGLVRGFRAEKERATIRLQTDYAFSALWLIPRMHAFRLLHPQLDIQIVATQRFQRSVMRDNDVAVVFGEKDDFGSDAVLLLPEVVTPVCAPAFLKDSGPFGEPSTLAKSTLIHLDASTASPWFEWKSYLSHFNTVRDAHAGHVDLRFNTYSLVVQAAVAGQGIAIGWSGLVDSLLSSGMLVEAGPTVGAPERGYWLLPPSRADTNTGHLCAWLTANARSG
ncbi:LysR family transcriptional regulator [Rhizobium sp. J15]|uniref:choline sulfate utilization transcriptional regulator n=1 Tax=Rhizobium sp. J15 TaxID=2035450 RepID=UPI000BE94137|nr:LysR family transcriptional regulator [Rhizobium sp. J15]PDT10932.1 LysR family transcriptional regulator [Rhizobium sp. J15]